MFGPGLECAKELLPRLLTPGGIVFLIGDRGPGKTQMATWFAAEMVKDGMTCGLYRKSLDLFGEIRGSWKQGAPKSEEEVIRTFKKARFLVIDEAQERGDTDSDRQWCDRMITHIIDHRYDSMLSTLIVANLNKQSYETTIPSSIRSRVAECGGVKACDWASYRA
jgi:DNA replication protein DnaC